MTYQLFESNKNLKQLFYGKNNNLQGFSFGTQNFVFLMGNVAYFDSTYLVSNVYKKTNKSKKSENNVLNPKILKCTRGFPC